MIGSTEFLESLTEFHGVGEMKMVNLKKSSWIALAVAGCLVAFTGSASANSITLTKSVGDGGGGGPPPTPSVYSVSSFFTVTVFANLTGEGGGQNLIAASLVYLAGRCHTGILAPSCGRPYARISCSVWNRLQIIRMSTGQRWK